MLSLQKVHKITEILQDRTYQFRGLEWSFEQPRIMGILNLTPDSFYDGGKNNLLSQALRQAEQMVDEGADFIDLGAVSTRPGAQKVDEPTESERLIPVLNELVKQFPALVFSVDTWRKSVAEKAIDAGAAIINDISGGTFDSEMIRFIGSRNIPFVLMHIQGSPENMQAQPIEKDAVNKVRQFFAKQTALLQQAGASQLVLDPGIGFGKSLDSNYQLLAGIAQYRIDQLPVLIGISRKSLINKVLNTMPAEALNGSSVLHTISLLNGANILRVHDVKEAVEARNLVMKFQENL